MLDPEIPPEVEGETGDGADAVHPITATAVAEADRIATVITLEACIRLLWTIVIEQCWAMTTARSRAGWGARDLLPATRRSNPNRCRCGRTRPRGFLRSSTTCFSWPRSRRRPAR